ncbi:MAG TPA: CDGSH iron-sulfur domain-containing protein [Acidobacteriaceae bacterium]
MHIVDPKEPQRQVNEMDMENATNTSSASGLKEALRDLLNQSVALYALVQVASRRGGDRQRSEDIESRLERSVMRPLKDALRRLYEIETRPDEVVALAAAELVPSDIDVATLDEKMFAVAKMAAALRLRVDAPPELLEAFAALLNLLGTSRLTDIRNRMAELASGQRGLNAEVRVAVDGPYLVTNVEEFTNWLGEELPLAAQLALCRCGQSSIKPYCDGTHAQSGFSGVKDPERVSDKRDEYKGQQIEIFDNRGICAHSGFCTDRLASVFHVGKEPFVTPSGGRLDEIIQAVRACPSGALSYAIDGVEARNQVDQNRPASIEVSKDGPYRITGTLRLVDEHGANIPRAEGSSREHFSLCRCGHSQNKPFCSGMHWSIQFKDPVADQSREPTLFEWAGGFPALLRMTRIFYSKYVPQDPLVGPLFARMSPDHPERVAAWLSEVFGGPDFYSQRYGGYSRMISQHVGKCITEEQRARWVEMLSQSADDAMLPDDAEFRAAFVAYLEWGSRIGKENSQQHAAPPPNMPVPRWWWVCNAKPGARISALASDSEKEGDATIQLPEPGETPAFGRHIKTLFRNMDRESMRFAFDLWSHDDVAKHAAAILKRLQAGTMPCDGAWPPAKIAVFEQWVVAGMPE